MNKSNGITKHRQKRKNELVQIMGGKCVACGYNKCLAALELHHIDTNYKDFSLSAEGNCRGIKKDIEEAKKCVLLCANCHREIHNGFDKKLIQFFDQDMANKIISSYNKEKKINHCIKCKKEIYGKLYCAECLKIVRKEKIKPSREDLKFMIRNQSFVSIGDKFGLSDNAIRKWCDNYNLPRKKTIIDSYTDEQWKNI